jgi:hypothetical protein
VFIGVAPFSVEVFFYEPLCVYWDCLLFHQRSFLTSPFAFIELTLFSSEVIFDEPLCVY